MNVTLTAWDERAACTWCEREKECVTVVFADGFLASVPLCWRCLQKAVRVRNRTQSLAENDAPPASRRKNTVDESSNEAGNLQ